MIGDTVGIVHDALAAGRNVLMEGARQPSSTSTTAPIPS